MSPDLSVPVAMATVFGIDAWILWLALAAVCTVVELSTVNLVSIWFVVGSLAALVADLLGAGIWVQVQIMVIVSGLLLYVFLKFRPHLGLTDHNTTATNADRFIGQSALVIEDIDPVAGKGQVQSLGQMWSATSSDSRPIPAGTLTIVLQIRGVRLVVRPQGESADTPVDPQ